MATTSDGRGASQALSAVLGPYVLRLAEPGWRDDAELRSGINVQNGEIVHPAVARRTAEIVANGVWTVQVADKIVPATASLKPLFDPTMEKVRA